jgi:hypothetical protein
MDESSAYGQFSVTVLDEITKRMSVDSKEEKVPEPLPGALQCYSQEGGRHLP